MSLIARPWPEAQMSPSWKSHPRQRQPSLIAHRTDPYDATPKSCGDEESKERTQGRKKAGNTCTLPRCCCEAPRRLTQAVAAGKPRAHANISAHRRIGQRKFATPEFSQTNATRRLADGSPEPGISQNLHCECGIESAGRLMRPGHPGASRVSVI